MQLENALTHSHALIKQAVTPGDFVIDATVGQGHDTLFLAQLVGSTGHVLGFDVQQDALAEAKQALTEANCDQHVQLVHDGHQNIPKYLPENQQVSAVMFNLGYLPGGDHSVVTQAQTTVAALTAACDALAPNGLVTVMVYTGHDGGEQESSAVDQFVQALPQREYHVLKYQFVNQVHQPPYLLVIQKRG